MDKKVTMQTKGVMQDDQGYWGIWRTLKKVGKLFIRVGETGQEAVSRYTKELLAMPIDKLKKKTQRPAMVELQSIVFDRASTIRKGLEKNGQELVFVNTFDYRYKLIVYSDYSYKILGRRKIK